MQTPIEIFMNIDALLQMNTAFESWIVHDILQGQQHKMYGWRK